MWRVVAAVLLGGGIAQAQPGGGGFGSQFTAMDEGTALPFSRGVDFRGAGVTCTHDATLNVSRCTIPGGGGGGGSSIVLDLDDDGVDESAGVTEIATVNDTNSIFTMPAADKLLVDMNVAWPACDIAGALSCSNCIGAAEIDGASLESELEAVVDLQDMQGAVTDAQVPNNITVDLATAATALAANGANCGAGQYPLGVDAAGAVEGCTADDDVPEAGDFGALTGGAGITNSAGTLATASSETDFLANGALVCGAGTRGRMQVHTTPLQYCDNAATPALQYAAYGNSSGVATSATALAADPSDCGANQYATTIASSGNLTCAQVNFNQLAGTATDAQVPNNITIDLAAAATALAANPTDCGANQFANAIVASGNLTCAQPNFTDLAGSATDAQVPNNITIDLATAATALAANGANCSAGSAAGGVSAAGAAEDCIDPIVSGEIDTCSELAAILTGQTTGSCGSVVLSNGPTIDAPTITGVATHTTGKTVLYSTPGNNPSVRAAEWVPTFTVNSGVASSQGIEISPTATMATGGAALLFQAVRAAGIYELTAAVPTQVITFQGGNTYRVSTASIGANVIPVAFQGGDVVEANNVDAGTVGTTRAFLANPIVRELGASGVMTMSTLTGYFSAPALTTNNATGDTTLTTMIHYGASATTGSGAGDEVLVNEIFYDAPNSTLPVSTSTPAGALAASFRSAQNVISNVPAFAFLGTGTAPVSVLGPVGTGIASATPNAQLQVLQGAAGNRVISAETATTGDDPTRFWTQQRIATTNATSGTANMFTSASDHTYLITMTVVTRCTGGSGCTAGQTGQWVWRATYTNTGGTLTEDNEGGGTCNSTDANFCYTFENITGAGPSRPTLDVNSTSVRVTVTGAANRNLTWHAHADVVDVGA